MGFVFYKYNCFLKTFFKIALQITINVHDWVVHPEKYYGHHIENATADTGFDLPTVMKVA